MGPTALRRNVATAHAPDMAVVDPRTWMQHLGTDACWELLASCPVGRIGVLSDGAPEIYPVNHLVDGHTVVFRTDPGSKLHALDRIPVVCFEVDDIDADSCAGWSVLLKGRAETLTMPEELRRVSALPLRYWTIGDKAHWVRIRPIEVTGRRIVPVDEKRG
jgi:nitroimidazol reductase NimA-like FMN-containing flavoprotein (pyridoxamine 5'-phosphate oxidase superfamily)